MYACAHIETIPSKCLSAAPLNAGFQRGSNIRQPEAIGHGLALQRGAECDSRHDEGREDDVFSEIEEFQKGCFQYDCVLERDTRGCSDRLPEGHPHGVFCCCCYLYDLFVDNLWSVR